MLDLYTDGGLLKNGERVGKHFAVKLKALEALPWVGEVRIKGMLAAVETAVAMGNAMPEVKAVADYVTDDVAHDGTVTAMQHFGLI